MSIFFLILHGLVNAGLYRDVLAAFVAFIVGKLVALRPLRRHEENQKKMIDLLNTETPGGLAEVVKELENRNKKKHRHTDADAPDKTTGHSNIDVPLRTTHQPPHMR